MKHLLSTLFLTLFTVTAAHAIETVPESSTAKPAQTYAQAAPVKWRACKADAECDAVAVGCWFWVIANKQSMDKVQANIGSPACAASVDPGPKPTTACIEGNCTDKWEACSKHSDCTAVLTRCSMANESNWKPVNKNYADALKVRERERWDAKTCPWESFKPERAPKAGCVDKTCGLFW